MRDAEVERFEGVERGVMGLLRLWKCVEKWEEKVSSGWWVLSRNGGERNAPPFARNKTANDGPPKS